MIPEWVIEELQTLDLGDSRCDQRLMTVLADLAPQPTVSLPAAVGGGRAETEAVYRFFENDHIDFADILTPHCDATLERIREHKVVVIAQDTSEIDLTRTGSCEAVRTARCCPMNLSQRPRLTTTTRPKSA